MVDRSPGNKVPFATILPSFPFISIWALLDKVLASDFSVTAFDREATLVLTGVIVELVLRDMADLVGNSIDELVMVELVLWGTTEVVGNGTVELVVMGMFELAVLVTDMVIGRLRENSSAIN